MCTNRDKLEQFLSDALCDYHQDSSVEALREDQARFVALAVSTAAARKKKNVNQRSYWAFVAAVFILAVVGGLWGTAGVHNSNMLSNGAVGKWYRSGTLKDNPIRFDNGAGITFGEGSIAEVFAPNGWDVIVDLKHGSITADVVGNGVSRWSVKAGPYVISVIGTQFSVKWDSISANLDVSVYRGVVRVDGRRLAKKGITLTAGSTLNAQNGIVNVKAGYQESPLKQERVNVENLFAVSDIDSAGTEPLLPENPRILDVQANKKSKGIKPARWVKLYKEEKYALAVDAALQQGIEKRLNRISKDKLWMLADAARGSGNSNLSKRALQTYRRRFPSMPRAKTAAYLLGRIYLEKDNQPFSAIEWFNIYLSEFPDGPLAEEALGKSIRAWDKAGVTEETQKASRRYLDRYPEGSFCEYARSKIR